jgi:hypothetical protein
LVVALKLKLPRLVVARNFATSIRPSISRRSRSRPGRATQILAADAQLQFDEALQELDVIATLSRTLASKLFMLSQESRQLQRLKVIREQDFRGRGHAAPSENRAM